MPNALFFFRVEIYIQVMVYVFRCNLFSCFEFFPLTD